MGCESVNTDSTGWDSLKWRIPSGNTDFNGLGLNREFPKGEIPRGEFQDGHHWEFPLGNPQQRWCTTQKGQMTGMNQLSVFTGSGLCQHMHMATVMEA